uniref:PDZ domain-containing protein n=1 Tax=Eptatretus burgeri TaxID=7764 RepID=A0A8C4WWJ9_EPTBU
MEEEVEVFLEKDHKPLTDDIQIEGGEKRGIYIKNVQKDSPVAKNLHLSEGDKLISATINFDDMKYDDAVRFLEISDKYMTELKLRKSSRGSPTSGTTTFDFESSETTVRGATTTRSPKGSTSYTPHNHHCSPNSMSCRWCSASKCIGATSPYMDLSPSDEHYSIIYEKKIKPRLSSSEEVGCSATNQRGKTSTSPREVV